MLKAKCRRDAREQGWRSFLTYTNNVACKVQAQQTQKVGVRNSRRGSPYICEGSLNVLPGTAAGAFNPQLLPPLHLPRVLNDQHQAHLAGKEQVAVVHKGGPYPRLLQGSEGSNSVQ